jgi:hypothetical protein
MVEERKEEKNKKEVFFQEIVKFRKRSSDIMFKEVGYGY